jgi:glutamate N-acetyltransferase/amino-acid N-acetyltransferase
MIHPNMATMLATVATNAAVEGDALQALLTRCVEQSFNAISVDGDCSTNDTVILVATGQGNAIVPGTDAFATLENAVAYVCQELAKKIARDGEGAKHLIEVVVQGLETDALARKAARAVASSNLVKAAVHGGDPNWGRIVGALGALGVPGLDQASVSICGTTVLNKGVPTPFDERLVSQSMNEPEVRFDIVLTGPGRGMAWGCDLTEEYVKINADYRS